MLGRLRARRGEQGAVAIVIALVTCMVLVPLAAYAVDIGVQRVARRDAQSVADVVALDLARQLDGRKFAAINPGLQALADKSAARNASGAGSGLTVVPELGTVADGAFDPDNPDAYFTKMTDPNGVPNAVRVTARSSVSFSLRGGNGGVVRSAISKAKAGACFDVGSYALNLDSQKSVLLDALVGDALNLSAISYTGLANASVSLFDLGAELGVGSVDGLLALNDLSLNQLYLASAKALQKTGGDTADIALLNQLANVNLGALPHIKLSDVLDLEPGNNSALATGVNLLDLVATSAFVANGTNALSVPSLDIKAVPGVLNVTSSLKIIEAPHTECTTNPVKTSQIDLDLHVTVANLDVLIFAAVTTVDLKLQVGTGYATRTNAFCGNPEGLDVSLATALAELSLSPTISLKLLGLPFASVYGSVGSTTPASSKTIQFRHPPDAYHVAKTTGSGVMLPNLSLSDLNLDLLGNSLPLLMTRGGILNAVLDTIVTPILNPLIGVLNTTLLTPLTGLLGVKLGGADVYVNDPPTCNNPVLAG